jgi:hypothetical protein
MPPKKNVKKALSYQSRSAVLPLSYQSFWQPDAAHGRLHCRHSSLFFERPPLSWEEAEADNPKGFDSFLLKEEQVFGPATNKSRQRG